MKIQVGQIGSQLNLETGKYEPVFGTRQVVASPQITQSQPVRAKGIVRKLGR